MNTFKQQSFCKDCCCGIAARLACPCGCFGLRYTSYNGCRKGIARGLVANPLLYSLPMFQILHVLLPTLAMLCYIFPLVQAVQKAKFQSGIAALPFSSPPLAAMQSVVGRAGPTEHCYFYESMTWIYFTSKRVHSFHSYEGGPSLEPQFIEL